MTAKTRQALVLKDFRDGGSGRRFTAGSTIELTEGEFLNFSTAELVRDPDPEDKAPGKATRP